MKPPVVQLGFREQLMLGATAAAATLLLAVRFLYLPVIGRIGEQRAMIRDLVVKTADAQALAAQRPTTEAALRDAQQRYRTLEDQVGSGQSVGKILELLGAQAKAHRLELTVVQQAPDELQARVVTLGPELTLREVPLTLQVSGRYRQIGEFLGGLQEAPFLSSVRTLTMAKAQAESPTLRAELVLAVYLAERSSAK